MEAVKPPHADCSGGVLGREQREREREKLWAFRLNFGHEFGPTFDGQSLFIYILP